MVEGVSFELKVHVPHELDNLPMVKLRPCDDATRGADVSTCAEVIAELLRQPTIQTSSASDSRAFIFTERLTDLRFTGAGDAQSVQVR